MVELPFTVARSSVPTFRRPPEQRGPAEVDERPVHQDVVLRRHRHALRGGGAALAEAEHVPAHLRRINDVYKHSKRVGKAKRIHGKKRDRKGTEGLVFNYRKESTFDL